MSKISCIYRIINQKNNKFYIGSTKDFKKRKNRHISELRKNRHHCIYLQRSYNIYGEEYFKFDIIEECDENKLFEKEKEWINKLKPKYNIGSVGGGDNITNHPDYIHIKKKLISYLKPYWKNRPKMYGKNNPNWRGGIDLKKKTCKCGNKKGCAAKACIKCTNREGKNNSFYNKRHSEKTKEMISKSNKGKIPKNRRKCKIDNIVYNSMTEASNKYGVCVATVCFRIKSKYFSTWEYI